MATLTLTIPDDQYERTVTALCLDGGWAAESDTSREDFARTHVAHLVQDRIRAVEVEVARQEALAGVTPPPLVDIT